MLLSSLENGESRTLESLFRLANDLKQLLVSMAVAATCWTAITAPCAAQVYRGVDLFTLAAPDGFNLDLDISVLKASGEQVAGNARSSMTSLLHAVVWKPGGTVVDLHPTTGGIFRQSVAAFTNGNQQVGTGLTAFGTENALLWNGSVDSVLNLQPTNLPNIDQSRALSTDGVQQAGVGVTPDHVEHALLWNGSGSSAVDLHPTNLVGFVLSNALSTNGGHRAGVGVTMEGLQHALVWSGTANSVVDLHPTNLAGFKESIAEATNGLQQVGIRFDR